MKVLNNVKSDFYNQTIDIQITVGELLMLKTAMGNSNSKEFAETVTSGHDEFKDKVVEEDLTFTLFNELSDLLQETVKGR
ncbi:hypothetical protein Kirov_91 [Bacillus phage Kirov]|uniref:Uncharacterized protein n=1 Tax=Bacillus phage Kirov TaxID=2783539 RepID=A0A7U3RXP4_9CAUD|nr:hypothetical protein PQE67_gp213 [Bacillus phage Kirov]QOV08290.1 hypothetical protein Kirov_91 [Bacillus phage Kirov]